MSYAANIWAGDQHPGRPLWKLVLLGTCNFVGKRTEKCIALPETVAEWCGITRVQTVSNIQQILSAKGFLVDTGERVGANGRSIVWTPGWKRPPLTTPSVASEAFTDNTLTTHSQHTDNTLATPSVASTIGKVDSNSDTDNSVLSDNDTVRNSVPLVGTNGSTSSVSFSKTEKGEQEKKQEQRGPACQHKKWPEFVAYCRRKGGQPKERGFWTWLDQQSEYWRDRVPKSFKVDGYVLVNPGQQPWECKHTFMTKAEGDALPPEMRERLNPADRDGSGTVTVEIIY